jgi:hypothetical protein
MRKRKKVAALNVALFGLFFMAFLFKFLILAAILWVIHAAVFVFTVQS